MQCRMCTGKSLWPLKTGTVQAGRSKFGCKTQRFKTSMLGHVMCRLDRQPRHAAAHAHAQSVARVGFFRAKGLYRPRRVSAGAYLRPEALAVDT